MVLQMKFSRMYQCLDPLCKNVKMPGVSRLLHQYTGAAPKIPPDESQALTTKIFSLLNSGRLPKAVSVLFASPVPFYFSLYAHLLQLCAVNRAIVETRKVESHLITFSPTPPAFLLNRTIESYGKCGCLDDARELFDEMPQRNGGSWNAMITAYAQNGSAEEGLNLFLDMNKKGVLPTEITFASVLGCCAEVLEFGLSRQIHGLILKYGLYGNVILGSSLVDIYGKCFVMSDARRLFDEIENPNLISWNVIVRRYLEMGDEKEVVFMFFEMIRKNTRPLNFTVSNALIACSRISALKEGIQIHGFSIKINFGEDDVVLNSLIDMYVKCGVLEHARAIFDMLGSKNLVHWTSMVSGYAKYGRTREAREFFDEMPNKNVISWNAMLAGYTRFSEYEEALDFVFVMRKETTDTNYVTVGLILHMCAGLSDVELGKQVHGFIYRHGYCSDVFVANALLHMYGKCGNLRSSIVWFHHMSHLRNDFSWNAVLTSFARHKMSEEAMVIFWEMVAERKTTPSNYNFGTLLAACANIFALDLGKQIHGYMIRNDYNIDIVVTGALVDMYSKCRCMEYAFKVFEEATCRDVILWNSLMLGCCHNGKGEKVLGLFELMEDEGIKPDNTTFQAILLACIDGARVELGRQYFDAISNKYYIIPRLEHYECMIELYGRNGFMNELENFVKNMPFEPTAPMLIKVFDFCREHRYLSLGEWAADQLNELNPLVPFRFQLPDKASFSMW